MRRMVKAQPGQAALSPGMCYHIFALTPLTSPEVTVPRSQRRDRRVSLFTRAGPVLPGSGPRTVAVVFHATLLKMRSLVASLGFSIYHRHRKALSLKDSFPLCAVPLDVPVPEVHEIDQLEFVRHLGLLA